MITNGLLETSDLLERIRSGEGSACDELFLRYRPRLEGFLRARLPLAARGLMETQDLVQEVCLRVLPELMRFRYRGIGSFWGYLRAIALNYVREVWRGYANKKRAEPLPWESWRAPEASGGEPLEGLGDSPLMRLPEQQLLLEGCCRLHPPGIFTRLAVSGL
ncbi:MAG: sigma-70 family RNA polymerase sigma factor, partial [Planctomycetota bacterium]